MNDTVFVEGRDNHSVRFETVSSTKGFGNVVIRIIVRVWAYTPQLCLRKEWALYYTL